ncbi:DUF1838 family protein [Nitrospirillum pindoramense]|uniref:Uncharacterized protein DUF1838 n=1 Tax=Nitrospirillum amazonense TaxID=28077 RepID=A0A560HHD2_9PROT|nr:DUF1838 family protein [Nitrospirillum amazonense]TWB45862.1 uncharacterized protein DUF1838 [Nitrospirillum amazonense]
MSGPELTRRESLGLATMAAAAGALGLASPARATAPAFLTRVDFKDPKWNRDAYARLDMDLDPTKQKVGWFRGTVYGVRDNEAVRSLFQVDGFSVVRSQQLPDGSWRRMLREIGFYRDLQTGQLMDTWHNPYTNEDVRVVPIANDPFNFTISEFLPEPPSYGGLNKDKPPKRPFLMNWTDGPDGTVHLSTDIHLFYPSALQPDKWPRESSGAFNRVSEMFHYVVKRRDLEDPAMTHVPAVGSWSRITPWLPWMLMGQAAGCISYFCTFGTAPSIDQLPADVVAKARAMDAKWLSAPDSDYGPSLSSLENYAHQQTPASVPAGWAPPAPPPPRTLPGR